MDVKGENKKDRKRVAIIRGKLTEAATVGDVVSTKLLLGKLGGSKCDPEDISEALKRAARNGHLEVVKLLTFPGKDFLCWITVKEAAYAGQLEIVKFVFSIPALGSDLIDKDELVYHAAKNGHVEIIKFLLLDPEVYPDRTFWCMSPLECAAANGHIEVVKLLLADSRLSQIGKSWILAADNDHPEIEKLIVLADKNTVPIEKMIMLSEIEAKIENKRIREKNSVAWDLK